MQLESRSRILYTRVALLALSLYSVQFIRHFTNENIHATGFSLVFFFPASGDKFFFFSYLHMTPTPVSSIMYIYRCIERAVTAGMFAIECYTVTRSSFPCHRNGEMSLAYIDRETMAGR